MPIAWLAHCRIETIWEIDKNKPSVHFFIVASRNGLMIAPERRRTPIGIWRVLMSAVFSVTGSNSEPISPSKTNDTKVWALSEVFQTVFFAFTREKTDEMKTKRSFCPIYTWKTSPLPWAFSMAPKNAQNNGGLEHLHLRDNWANSICWWGPCDTVKSSRTSK